MNTLTYEPDLEPLPLARALWDAGRRDEAIATFLSAHERQPGNLAAALDAARALGSGYRIAEAEILLEKLRPHVASLPVLELRIGQVLREMRRPEKALESFGRALRALPDSIDAIVEYAQLLERSGDYAGALTHVLRGKEKSVPNPLLDIFEARLSAALGEKENAKGIYRRLVDDRAIPVGLRARAMHELAVLIDGEEPEVAMRLIRSAHALMSDGSAPQLERGRVAMRMALTLGAAVTREFLAERKAAVPVSEKSDVLFLLGFARSGTTLIEKMLSGRNRFADAEELDLFGLYVHPLLVGTLGEYTKSDAHAEQVVAFLRKRYLDGMREYFGRPVPGLLVDKNPSHTALCASLARVFPEGRFLVVLRDPRDTILSAYFQYLPANPESAAFRSLDTLAERYVDTMTAWLDLRPKLDAESWREVRYEEFIRAPEEQVEALSRWLGSSECAGLADIKGHVHSPSHADVRKPVYAGQSKRWRRHESEFSPAIREKLEPIMTRLGYVW